MVKHDPNINMMHVSIVHICEESKRCGIMAQTIEGKSVFLHWIQTVESHHPFDRIRLAAQSHSFCTAKTYEYREGHLTNQEAVLALACSMRLGKFSL